MVLAPLFDELISNDGTNGTANDETHNYFSHHFAGFQFLFLLFAEWPHTRIVHGSSIFDDRKNPLQTVINHSSLTHLYGIRKPKTLA